MSNQVVQAAFPSLGNFTAFACLPSTLQGMRDMSEGHAFG